MLVVSKVANFSIDLPEATVAIQVSGTFGSRQEEAQRLGRVLRPKADGHEARFYSVVARDTIDQDFAAHRQRFLAEQGYAYRIVDADELLAERARARSQAGERAPSPRPVQRGRDGSQQHERQQRVRRGERLLPPRQVEVQRARRAAPATACGP